MLEQITHIGGQVVTVLNQVDTLLLVIAGLAGLRVWGKNRVAENIRRESEQARQKLLDARADAERLRGVVLDGVAYAQHLKEQGADDPNAKPLTGADCKRLALTYVNSQAPDLSGQVTSAMIQAAVTKLKGAKKITPRDPSTGRFAPKPSPQ